MGNQSLLILTSSFSRTVVIKLNFSLESLEELLKTILIFRADFLSSGSKHTPETKSISIVWKPVEMQILRPHHRPTESETGFEAQQPVLASPSMIQMLRKFQNHSSRNSDLLSLRHNLSSGLLKALRVTLRWGQV